MYRVALKYASGPKQGIIDWIDFSDKEGFQRWFTKDMRKDYKVIGEDVSHEQTVNLVHRRDLG